MATMLASVQLARRAKRYETAVARFRRWAIAGTPLALVEVRSKLHLPPRWLIVRRLDNGNETIISRHRRRTAALKALSRRLST